MPFNPRARIVGIDDGPFRRVARASVLLVGVLMRGAASMDGVGTTRVVRDGWSATRAIARMLSSGRLAGQAQAVLVDGIAVGGFNVIDLPRLSEELRVPVLAVMRKQPDLEAVHRALLRTRHADRRWATIRAAGPIHAWRGLRFQVCGAGIEQASRILDVSMGEASYPEALRLAHMIAGAMVTGESRGRP